MKDYEQRQREKHAPQELETLQKVLDEISRLTIKAETLFVQIEDLVHSKNPRYIPCGFRYIHRMISENTQAVKSSNLKWVEGQKSLDDFIKEE